MVMDQILVLGKFQTSILKVIKIVVIFCFSKWFIKVLISCQSILNIGKLFYKHQEFMKFHLKFYSPYLQNIV